MTTSSHPLPRWMRFLAQRECAVTGLIVVLTVVVALVDVGFLSIDNLRNILTRSAPTAIVACGVMLVILTGEIDISVGSLVGLLAAVLGITLSQHHWDLPIWAGILITLVAGSTVGLITGILVTWGQVPSIIVTLGLLTTLRGITTWTMQGENIDGLPTYLGNLTKFGPWGIPLSLWVATVVIGLTGILIVRTATGRRIFAVGSSPEAASTLGLPVRRLKVFVFAYTGFLTAVATIVDVPRYPKIEAGMGTGFELLVVTCVVVGGVSIAGGRGKLRGVLLAVLLMTMIRPALTFLDIGEAGEKWTKAIQGMFIILAVVSDSLAARRGDSVH